MSNHPSPNISQESEDSTQMDTEIAQGSLYGSASGPPLRKEPSKLLETATVVRRTQNREDESSELLEPATVVRRTQNREDKSSELLEPAKVVRRTQNREDESTAGRRHVGSSAETETRETRQTQNAQMSGNSRRRTETSSVPGLNQATLSACGTSTVSSKAIGTS